MRASDGVDAVRVISRSDECDFFVTFLFSAAGVTPVYYSRDFLKKKRRKKKGLSDIFTRDLFEFARPGSVTVTHIYDT